MFGFRRLILLRDFLAEGWAVFTEDSKRDKVLMLTRNSGCFTINRKYQGRADVPAVGIILQYYQEKQGGNMDENM